MNLLLDTHALLWALADVEELHPVARDAIEDTGNEVFASAASVWEMAIKSSLGKLDMPDDLSDQLTWAGIRSLPVVVRHAHAVKDLPMHHRDPFDRLLVSQARLEGLTLVTRDATITQYQIDTLKC